jgi:hypothetical protein
LPSRTFKIIAFEEWQVLSSQANSYSRSRGAPSAIVFEKLSRRFGIAQHSVFHHVITLCFDCLLHIGHAATDRQEA